jgi:hypothetical protein
MTILWNRICYSYSRDKCEKMKKAIFFSFLFISCWSCEKEYSKSAPDKDGIIAQIVDFDLNCSTCILEFPYDSTEIKNEIGLSKENRYEATNLNRSGFRKGELIKVQIRKATSNDFLPCITMYPSNNFLNIFVNELIDIKNIKHGDVNDIRFHDCLYNPENESYICFDSVLSDSRCPMDATCFWAGMAEVKFRFVKLPGITQFFVLNTNTAFRNDTIIDGYKYTLVNLRPAPEIDQRTRQQSYTAGLKIEKL